MHQRELIFLGGIQSMLEIFIHEGDYYAQNRSKQKGRSFTFFLLAWRLFFLCQVDLVITEEIKKLRHYLLLYTPLEFQISHI